MFLDVQAVITDYSRPYYLKLGNEERITRNTEDAILRYRIGSESANKPMHVVGFWFRSYRTLVR